MAKKTKYTLTQADLESFLSEKESAGAIARRHGVTHALVTYYLRKLNDPRVAEILARNSNKAKHDFANAKREKLDQMLLSGASVSEIVIALQSIHQHSDPSQTAAWLVRRAKDATETETGKYRHSVRLAARRDRDVRF